MPASLRAAQASGWLSWAAPPECQNTPEVERRLQLLLGRDVDFASVPATAVKMGWSAEQGWSVRVTVALAEGARVRALSAPSCADAFDLVALSLALILDPEFGAGLSAAQLGGEAVPPGADVETSAVSAVDVDAAPSGLGMAELQSKAEPAELSHLESPGTPAAPPGSLDAAANDGEAAPVPKVLSVAVSALVDLAVFPVLQFGGDARAGLDFGAVRLELGGKVLASESTLLPNALYPVRFSSFAGEILACRTFQFGARLDWLVCAGTELGGLATTELGGLGRRTAAPWFAGAIAMGPEFLATEGLSAFARVRAAVPLLRHELVLAGGGRVHEFPPLSVQLEVGVLVDVTDFGGAGH